MSAALRPPSRWRRGPAPRALRIGPRVAATLVDLFHLGAAETHAVALLYQSHGPDAPTYVFKAWPRVWRAGYVTKLAAPISPGLLGSVADIFLCETGLAQAVMDAGMPLERVDAATATLLRDRADADRARLAGVLVAAGLDAAVVARQLKLHGEQARRALARLTHLLGHATKNARFVAPFLYAARKSGCTVAALRGDRGVIFTAESERGPLLCAPDTTLALTRDGFTTLYCVETETGARSAQTLRAKVAAWAGILADSHRVRAEACRALHLARVDEVQLIVYGPARLLATVHATLAAQAAGVAAAVRTVQDDVVHTAYPAAVFRRNAVVPGTRTPCLAFYRELFHAPIAGVVHGRGSGGRPEVRWFPLLA